MSILKYSRLLFDHSHVLSPSLKKKKKLYNSDHTYAGEFWGGRTDGVRGKRLD